MSDEGTCTGVGTGIAVTGGSRGGNEDVDGRLLLVEGSMWMWMWWE